MIAERSRDSGSRSRDRRPTVKAIRFLDGLQAELEKNLKKVAGRSRVSVVGGHEDRRLTVKQRFKQL